jgi:hypothetical protein
MEGVCGIVSVAGGQPDGESRFIFQAQLQKSVEMNPILLMEGRNV